MKIYQQGDILFKQITEIPTGEIEIIPNGIVAEGEATGHHHRVANNHNVQVAKIGTALYVIAHTAAKILHEEHKEIILPPGVFFVDKVKEYDHFSEETRKVMD